MSIKVGDWVRHADRTRNGVSGEVKRVMAVDEDGYILVFDNRGERWRPEKCILCHPPRDKKPPRKVSRKELDQWLAAQQMCVVWADVGVWQVQMVGNTNARFGTMSGKPPYGAVVYGYGDTPAKAIIAARAAMRRKERGK